MTQAALPTELRGQSAPAGLEPATFPSCSLHSVGVMTANTIDLSFESAELVAVVGLEPTTFGL